MTAKSFIEGACKDINFTLKIYARDGKTLLANMSTGDVLPEDIEAREVLSLKVTNIGFKLNCPHFFMVVDAPAPKKTINERFADIMIYVPATDEIVKISEGSGCNLDAEDEENGSVDYIYYEQYDSEDFSEKDGGQIMKTRLLREIYHDLKRTIPEVLDMAYDNSNLEYVLIK